MFHLDGASLGKYMIKINASNDRLAHTHSLGTRLFATLDLKILYDWEAQKQELSQDIGEELTIQHLLENV